MSRVNNFNYKVIYKILDSSLVYNECGPTSAGPVGWDDYTIKKREKAAEKYIMRLNEKNGFYNKLEKSILKDGIRNPILANAGWIPERKLKRIPPHYQENLSELLVCHSLGGSRLWIAQKYNLEIPCIITDFVGMFNDGDELRDEDDVMNKFIDKPKRVVFGPNGIAVSSVPQVHLREENG